MIHLEILAPAGGWPQLEAAVRTGADAVYFGSTSFNARMSADNFTDLEEVVRYCHIRGVKAYVTLNTLILDNELPEAAAQIESIARSGADAMLTADLGIARIARLCCPGLPLHASTQMTVHNLSGALQLKELGFTRVVLAREMSRDEIALVSQHSGLETEVFVHGALCMCLSGQCYLSSFFGQRSGNRGRCAQPCRLDFQFNGRDHVLSLKDLTLSDRIGDLEAIGVTSAKIEGRLKRPEYVAAAVRACTAYREGRSVDLDQLRSVFSRSGFTSGYYDGRRDLSMFGIRSEEDKVRSENTLHSIREYYRREHQRVKVNFAISYSSGRYRLTCGDGTNTAVAAFPAREGLERPLSTEAASQSLGKLGGTPYLADEILYDLSDSGLRCKMSDISTAKQEVISALSDLRGRTVPHAFQPYPIASPEKIPISKQRIIAFLSRPEQMTEALTEQCDFIYLPSECFQNGFPQNGYGRIGMRIDPFLFGGAEEKTAKLLSVLRKEGLKHVSAGNLSGIHLANENGLHLFGEFRLGIMNNQALLSYRSIGIREYDLSVEAPFSDTHRLFPDPEGGLLVYGHIPLMSFRACPCSDSGCARCSGHPLIRDRYGEAFPVLCRNRQYQMLLNPRPLCIYDLENSLSDAGHLSFLFTTESPDQCLQVLNNFRQKIPPDNFTRGLYNKQLL